MGFKYPTMQHKIDYRGIEIVSKASNYVLSEYGLYISIPSKYSKLYVYYGSIKCYGLIGHLLLNFLRSNRQRIRPSKEFYGKQFERGKELAI